MPYPVLKSRRQIVLAMGVSLAGAAIGARAAPTGQSWAGRRIDVHAHFLPLPYRKALQAAGMQSLDGGIPIPAWDSASTLAAMNRLGAGAELLSISSPALNFLDTQQAISLARVVNQEAAALVRAQPSRFGAYATLPLQDVQASLRELSYALDVLGLDGVMLTTNVRGRYIGDPAFLPLFKELNRRGAVCLVHPTSPPATEAIGVGVPAPLLEFPFDTTRAVVDLIRRGTLDRCPDVKLILSHGGGALPMLASRLDFGLRRSDAEAILARLYYDTATITSSGPFSALRALAAPSHVLYGSDHGFASEQEVDRTLRALDQLLTDSERPAIYRDAALKLFPRFA